MITRMSTARRTKHMPATEPKKHAAKDDMGLVALFQSMAKDVPAYKKFLKSNGIKPETIASREAVRSIPAISKSNYLRVNTYTDLFWHGTMETSHILTSTSGSTGEPFYFARSHDVDKQSAMIHERFFLSSSLSKSQSTLAIVCFGMGVWIGGVITYQAFQTMAKQGYPLSVITPGINKVEILKILRNLAPHYKQIIMAGYPPFIKDILDEASESGISFKHHRMAFVFAAEAFTEKFRDYIVEKADIKNPLTDTMNIYGSADLGTMAFETPISILVRRLASKNPALFKELFGDIHKTPTLAQYIPAFTLFEAEQGQLLVSANSAIPLLRYAIGDNGGILNFEDIAKACARHHIDLKREIKQAKLSAYDLKNPFVYVYERSDLSATLYGLQIYPETIKEVVLHTQFSEYITGRLAIATKFDRAQNQYIEINIESRPNKLPPKKIAKLLLIAIQKNLLEKNAEYKELSKFLGKRAEPRLVFWPYEDSHYFRRDVKQKWVIKNS